MLNHRLRTDHEQFRRLRSWAWWTIWSTPTWPCDPVVIWMPWTMWWEWRLGWVWQIRSHQPWHCLKRWFWKENYQLVDHCLILCVRTNNIVEWLWRFPGTVLQLAICFGFLFMIFAPFCQCKIILRTFVYKAVSPILIFLVQLPSWHRLPLRPPQTRWPTWPSKPQLLQRPQPSWGWCWAVEKHNTSMPHKNGVHFNPDLQVYSILMIDVYFIYIYIYITVSSYNVAI